MLRTSLLFLFCVMIAACGQSDRAEAPPAQDAQPVDSAPASEEFGISEQGEAAVKESKNPQAGANWLRTGTRLTFDIIPDTGSKCTLMTGELQIGSSIRWDYTTKGCTTLPRGATSVPNSPSDTSLVFYRNSPASPMLPPPMWMSKRMFKLLREGKTVAPLYDQGSWKLEKQADFSMSIDGRQQTIPVISAVNEKGHRVTVYDNQELPLIVKIEIAPGYDVLLLKAGTK